MRMRAPLPHGDNRNRRACAHMRVHPVPHGDTEKDAHARAQARTRTLSTSLGSRLTRHLAATGCGVTMALDVSTTRAHSQFQLSIRGSRGRLRKGTARYPSGLPFASSQSPPGTGAGVSGSSGLGTISLWDHLCLSSHSWDGAACPCHLFISGCQLILSLFKRLLSA